ncbi:MAG: hypothetical protein C5B49_14435 [Bdellovibrio sp.]|nr:MAG: hypothetical protein C5B49_14435 [Bdellovibrio sp.]
MLKTQPETRVQSQAGTASIEMVPLLLLFAMLFNFTLGFFGIIHSGILQNIAARNYAFETFRNRPNLAYLRDEINLERTLDREIQSRYSLKNLRYHGIVAESGGEVWPVTKRPIRFTDVASPDPNQAPASDHKQLVRQVQSTGKVSETFTGKTAREDKFGFNVVWLQILYGICLKASCRPE